MTDDKMLARIAALLRQAEGTDNAHEAEAFMAAAQRLATATSIDLAVARSHSEKRTKAQTPVQRTITIGNAGARGLRTYVQLFVVIANANDVKCDIASNSTFVYAYGFAEDIDASHALYAGLVMQMVKASEAYISSGAAPTDPDHHRADQLPAGVRRPRREAVVGGPRGGPAGGDQEQEQPPRHRDRIAGQGHRAEVLLSSDLRCARIVAGHQRNGRVLVVGKAGGRSRGPTGAARQQLGTERRAHRARPVTTRDTQRSKVYAAEEFVRTLFDRAGEHGNRTIDFFGTSLTLPPEGRFASVETVQRYVDDVLALGSVRARWPAAAPLTARPRRGVTAAHYERTDDGAAIAVPERRTNWAMRELVVLHEVAHHLCDADPPHGPEFVATFCELAEAVMGPEVAHVLRVVYAKEGVR